MLSPPGVAEKEPTDLLNKRKCLEYLAALRHAKWFQVNASQACQNDQKKPSSLVSSMLPHFSSLIAPSSLLSADSSSSQLPPPW